MSLQVGEYMLRPEKLAALARELEGESKDQPSLPSDVYGEGVRKQLSTQFDPTQFGAISVSCFPLFLHRTTSRNCSAPGKGWSIKAQPE